MGQSSGADRAVSAIKEDLAKRPRSMYNSAANVEVDVAAVLRNGRRGLRKGFPPQSANAGGPTMIVDTGAGDNWRDIPVPSDTTCRRLYRPHASRQRCADSSCDSCSSEERSRYHDANHQANPRSQNFEFQHRHGRCRSCARWPETGPGRG